MNLTITTLLLSLAVATTGCNKNDADHSKAKPSSAKPTPMAPTTGTTPSTPPPKPPGTAPTPVANAEPAGPGCPDVDGKDAGDTDDTALPTQPGVIEGCVNNTNDKADMFVVTAPEHAAGTLYVVKVRVTEGSVKVDAQNGDGKQIFGSSITNGGGSKGWFVLAPKTKAYVRVARYVNDTGSYALTTEATPIPDTFEPNSTRAQAKQTALGATISAFLVGAVNDTKLATDYYSLDVPKPGKLTVLADGGGAKAMIQVDILDRDGVVLASKYAANRGAAVRQTVALDRAGHYLIRVKEYLTLPRGDGGKPAEHVTTPYTLTASME